MKRFKIASGRLAKTLGRLLKPSLRKLGLIGASLGLVGSTIAGCSRQKYRSKTDREAYYLLDEKRAQSCEQEAATIRIEVDPRSRMFDPFNPDRPPMPEDDPQAHRFMRCVDQKKGYPLWEGNGRTNMVENPEWWNYLPLDDRGVLVLDLDDAVRLALLHSPSYQSNLETMYLSALDVSIERFLLDSQFFGTTGNSFTRTGPVLAGDPFGSTVPSRTGSFSMSKLYSTGATLVADWANSLTWQIAGPDTFVAPSTLSFTLLQPLLRRGGRDVVLERLTLAERALLTNVRAFERYRRGFYVQVATGTAPDTSPSRRGGAFGGAGLGGFDALGSVFQNAGGGGGAFGGGNVQNANGYIGLLQDQLNIDNQRENIIRLQDIYLQYADNYRELLSTMPASQTEIPSTQLQVAQAQQSVFQAQADLLQLQAGYEGSLDAFKRTLGLPPYLCIEIEGDLLRPFELISKDLRNRRTEVSQYRAAVGNRNSALLELTKVERDPDTGEVFRSLPASQNVRNGLDVVAQEMTVLEQFITELRDTDLLNVAEDVETLRKNVPLRRQQLNRLKDIAERERGMVCSLLPLGDFNTTFLEGDGLEELPDELTREAGVLYDRVEEQLEELKVTLATIQDVSDNLEGLGSDRDRFSKISEDVILRSQDLIASVNETVLGIQLVQARARTEAAILPEIDLEPRDALEIARRNRRDWLIQKASLVDTWRRIELVADDLESVLNVSLSGSVGNVGNNPFAFHSSNGTLRAGLTWDAPITRVQERNNYRQILIQYQQARRGYYQYEDGVWNALRATLRDIRQSQLAFEIQRFAVQNAALQISVNEDIRQINETLGQVSGPTAARDAVQGLQDFLRTQSQLIGIFATFEARRRVLDRDLGTMQIDAEGLWIDPGPITLETVGGSLGAAIRDGLSEGEELVPSQMFLDEMSQDVTVSPLTDLPMVIPGEQTPGLHGEHGIIEEAAQPPFVNSAGKLPNALITPVSWNANQ